MIFGFVVVVGMFLNPYVIWVRLTLWQKGIAYHYLQYGGYLTKWKPRLAIKMWTLMTYDFNHYKTQDALWKRIQFSLRKNQCVLVFHDNIKSSKHTRWLLNRTLLEVKRLSKETAAYS